MSKSKAPSLQVVSNCTSGDCPSCAREFFQWYKSRMAQMHHTVDEGVPSFAEAAATSVKPPKMVSTMTCNTCLRVVAIAPGSRVSSVLSYSCGHANNQGGRCAIGSSKITLDMEQYQRYNWENDDMWDL